MKLKTLSTLAIYFCLNILYSQDTIVYIPPQPDIVQDFSITSSSTVIQELEPFFHNYNHYDIDFSLIDEFVKSNNYAVQFNLVVDGDVTNFKIKRNDLKAPDCVYISVQIRC